MPHPRARPLRPLPPLAGLGPPPACPSQGTLPRVAGSARRTSHLNITWPGGRDTDAVIGAAARDLVTTQAGEPVTVGGAELTVTVDRGRVLTAVSAAPPRAALRNLVGASGGSGYRKLLREVAPREEESGSLLYFLLDDVPGVTLVGASCWQLWPGMATVPKPGANLRRAGQVSGVCSGFRADGPTVQRLLSDPRAPSMARENLVPAPDLATADDPFAWHAITPPPEGAPMMRRRRLVDVAPGQAVHTVSALFRDSIWGPGGEMVIHEYALRAAVDARSMRLTDVQAEPRVLPFGTCPAAGRNVDLLLGEPVRSLRRRTLDLITGTDGCTHLTDALRALAEVPVLLDGTLDEN